MRFQLQDLIVVLVLSPVSSLHVGFGGPRASSSTLSKQRAAAIDIPTTRTNTQTTEDTLLAHEDQWIANLDYDAFAKDVSSLGKELLKETGVDDVQHLKKIVSWRNFAAILGLATVWMPLNLVTVAALSTWTYASWTMIAHHTCHGGYNRVDAGRFNSRGFGLGLVNRVIDWLDWMQPEAWNIEHNRLHHYRLNEGKDPDLVQRNLDFLRDSSRPLALKYLTVAMFLPIWKW